MQDPFFPPLPENDKPLLRYLQQCLYDRGHHHIRQDGQMDQPTLDQLCASFPPQRAGEKDYKELWRDYTLAQAGISGPRPPMRPSDDIEIRPYKARHALHHRLAADQDEEIIHYKRELCDILKTDSPDADGLIRARECINLLRPETPLPMTAVPTKEFFQKLDEVLTSADLSRIAPYWQRNIPRIREQLTDDGVKSLDARQDLYNDGQRLRVYYSFDGEHHASDVNPLNKTGPHDTINLADIDGKARSVFREAIAEIKSAIPVDFIELPKGVAPPPDATNSWRVYAGDIGVKHIAAYADYPNAERDVSALVFDRRKSIGTAFQKEFMLHEIGHALGLKHPFDLIEKGAVLNRKLDTTLYTLMSYTRNGNNRDGLSPLDIAALQEKYGTNYQQNLMNTLYEIDQKVPTRVLTDQGGYDVISATRRHSTIPLFIDLTGDVQSPAAQHTPVIRVAEGSRIESFVGGESQELIYSGHHRHRLHGGGGEDTFHIPGRGTHYIDDFDLRKDHLELPDMDGWKMRRTKDGQLHLHGVNLTGERVDVVVKPSSEKDLKLLASEIDPSRSTGEMLAADKEKLHRANEIARKEIGAALRLAGAWIEETGGHAIEEISHLQPGDPSRITARPVGVPKPGPSKPGSLKK